MTSLEKAQPNFLKLVLYETDLTLNRSGPELASPKTLCPPVSGFDHPILAMEKFPASQPAESCNSEMQGKKTMAF
jgi:hypothetical protein